MKNEKSFVVMYSPFENSLLGGYETIHGKTLIEAARNYIKGKFNSVVPSADKAANLSLIERWYDAEKRTIHKQGRQHWYLCENK